MKPTLLLDIDGVCLPFTQPEEGVEVFAHHQTLTVPYDLAERLHTVFQTFDVTWCTAWEKDSSIFAEALNLPDRPHLTFRSEPNLWCGGDPLSETTWKLGSVARFVAKADAPVIWVDDELYSDAERWADETGTALLRTDPDVGLTADDLNDLFLFHRDLLT